MESSGRKKHANILNKKKKRDECNYHMKGHINTEIMCFFTLMKAICWELITRKSICAIRLIQLIPVLIYF